MSTFIGKSETTRRTLELLRSARLASQNVLLWGAPGIGKTALIRTLAEQEDAELRILIGSVLDPTDVAGLPILSTDENGTPITRSTLPDWAAALNAAAEAGRGAILFLDELSTTTPSVQAALLSLVQGRLVGQHKLHDDVWIVAAANDSSVAADGWTLAPPMANRFSHADYAFDQEDWFDGMRVGFGKENISDSEKEARGLIIAFLRQNIKLISSMPDDPDEAGKAWPSPRSWDNAATHLGYIKDKAVRRVALRGYVGDTAESAYDLWHKALKLPPYAEVIANPDKFAWDKFKTDEVYMILQTVLDNVNKDNIKESANVFEVANTKGSRTDVCAALALPLIETVTGILNSQGIKDRTILLNLFKSYSKELKEADI